MKSRSLLAGCLSLCLAGGLGLDQSRADVHKNDIPPRRQWNENDGYCGETSFISAGLYYGQYCSQYTARKIASPGVPQSAERSQLLLGANDLRAAKIMRLNARAWHSGRDGDSRRFLVWVKQHVLRGYPVIIGVFNNESILYGNTDPNAGDNAYDHIVIVNGIGSNHRFGQRPGRYFASDRIFFSDNGLFGTGKNRQYEFSYRFGPFQKDRQEANAEHGALYSLKDNGANFGVAITGVLDRHGDTIPVRLETDVNYERPEIRNGSSRRPRPFSLRLTATVTLPKPGAPYNLYLYDHFEDVPDSRFNANADKASRVWHIRQNSGGTFQVSLRIMSDKIAVFRAVPASAP